MDSASRKQSRKNKVRLHKYMAECGLGSRRACERLVAEGRVSVDGRIQIEMGVQVDPEKNLIRVDGREIGLQRKVCFLFNKPQGVLCTASDPQGRKTFRAFFGSISERVYTVGRLDRDSEGLIIVTNDGDMAFKLAHPRHHVDKTYEVWVSGKTGVDLKKAFTEGVISRGEKLTAQSITPKGDSRGTACFTVVLKEGKNRQIRRMFSAVGLKVQRLRRTAIGSLELGDLRSGSWRCLTEDEIMCLEKTALNKS